MNLSRRPKRAAMFRAPILLALCLLALTVTQQAATASAQNDLGVVVASDADVNACTGVAGYSRVWKLSHDEQAATLTPFRVVFFGDAAGACPSALVNEVADVQAVDHDLTRIYIDALIRMREHADGPLSFDVVLPAATLAPYERQVSARGQR